MVELVDDHHVELIALQLVQIQPGQRLHRCKDVPPLLRALAADEPLAERAAADHVAQGD